MNELLAQFHFLRPLWLLAIIPALLLVALLWKCKGSAANWRAAIAPDLIEYLLESTQQLRPRWPWLLLFGWLLAVFALAGPTWEKLPQPVLQKRDGLVIVLDLSLSMYAEDIKPSRLQRARFKVIDILQQRREGLTGLVVYSGDAHVVSPLTDDTATIENLVPALAPAMMPSFGSNVVAGIDSALQLLRNSGFERGQILLISDEISEVDIDKISAHIDGKKWQLAMIGVGSDQGAPIPLPRDESQNGFLKQSDGTIAIAQLHRDRFNPLAAKVHGRYSDISADDNDIAQILYTSAITDDTVRTLEREFDQWRERGPQIVMLLLPLAAFAFRRGWLLVVFLIPFSMPSEAWEWRDLWQRPDQQAQQDFNSGNSKAAADKFQDPNWRGAAQYRSGDFSAAAETLRNIDNADAHYNRGNALAHDGKLADAIAAYNTALKKNPALVDAKTNRDIAEKLLKQQQQKNSDKNQSQENQQKNDQPKQNQSQQDQSQSDKEKQNPSQAQESDQKQSQHDQQRANTATDKNHKDSDKKDAQQQNSSVNEKPSQDKTDSTSAIQDNAQRDKSQQMSDVQQKSAASKLTPEQQMQQHAIEQWLRQIPDDPSGLLRRKFLYEYRQRAQQQPNDENPTW